MFFLGTLFSAAACAAPVILVYGDSLSAGHGVPQDSAWTALLQQRLHAEKSAYRVENASISGETTLGGRNRIAAALTRHRPEIVIVALGANDGLRGQAIPAMEDSLDAILRACRRRGARVLLIGMRLPPNYGAAYVRQFAEVFPRLARKHRAPLVPFLLEGFADKKEYFQADGLHPAMEAQPLIAENVWKYLQPMLQR